MNRKSGLLTKIIWVFICLGIFYISSGYGFERKQPLPIPTHNVFHSAFSPKGNSSFCLIQSDHDAVKYYWNGFGKGDGIAVYMDPSACGWDSAHTYPFKLTNVHLYLYDPGSFVWPVEITVNVRQVHPPEDSIRSPGGLLFYKTFSIPADSGYDTLNPKPPMNLNLDTVFCVNSPFFLEVIYTGVTDSAYPSLIMSDTTDRPDTNQDWLLRKGNYYEWHDAWILQRIPGRAIMRVTGYPQAIDCNICWYWKPKTTGAPAGIPDFDQYQFGSDTVALDAPAAMANGIVWFNAIPSVANPDSLIRLLSYYFHTNTSAGGGTLVDSIKFGLDSLFANYGLNLYDTIIQNPTFHAMSDSLEKSANIILLLGLWQKISDTWYRIGGHYVSMSGACNYDTLVAISDPAFDKAEAGAKGRILPPHDPHADNHTLHNTPGFVSQDVYVSDTLSVGHYGKLWRLKDYTGGNVPWFSQFQGQNFQPEQLPHSYDSTENVYAVVEYAILIFQKVTLVEEEEEGETPRYFELFQNYPNPFNPVTRIQYAVGSRQLKAAVGGRWTADSPPLHTTLKIYNILGQKTRTLVDEPKTAGNYEVIWDGKDDRGRELSSGIYFYQLKVGEFSRTKRMILLK